MFCSDSGLIYDSSKEKAIPQKEDGFHEVPLDEETIY